MKRISIWDMDWFYNFRFEPNYKAMKLSSYHKQLGDSINFITEENHINFDYDIIYVLKERSSTPFPPLKILDNQKSKLIGEEFFFYETQWELPLVINAVRPDYALYPFKEKNIYKNANIVKLLHNGKYIEKKQDYINPLYEARRKSLVVDEDLWDAEKDVIKKSLKELQKLKNIVFLKPIKLKSIIFDKEVVELFSKLKVMSGTAFKFENDCEENYENNKLIIDFIREFKDNNSIRLNPVEIKSINEDHWNGKNQAALKDLERLLKTIDYAKSKKVQIVIKKPFSRSETPYWGFFDTLETWTRYYQYDSYVDAMTRTASKRHGIEWYEVLNNPLKWSTPSVHLFLNLYVKYKDILEPYFFRKWGEEKTNKSKIKEEKLLQFDYKFNREDFFKIAEKNNGDE